MRRAPARARTSASTIAVAAALGALLAGCATSPAEAPADAAAAASPVPGSAEIATYRDDGDGMEALLTGTLVERDGCLYLETPGYAPDGGSAHWLPILPERTTRWDGTTLALGDESHRVGDEVSLGGGVSSEPTSPYDLSGMEGIPDACSTEYAWLAGPPREPAAG
ncbi:hypothetical protein ACR8AL_12795 [Clavibacter sepedonicus]|uniref:Lipoprotein n=1 Tax=Clavibacter sepedonicus TaxID=31964 RepID=B0RGJ6_CLASE|nr:MULTISPECIES: hypothetical protein [Clavibacter]MBD5381529.1 hypothetical protein [Clavibacter sp.]OQJ47996.1 hypothetical protein B5P19_06660 [Clavibacter sepedonicus]OQJ53551.1 hypothetical protein B5P20_04910 [Clavibacter sepedonicus]UUK66342.1 hypothetical protein LRE50_03730 [Clavibacter sepedonicus]CAQ02403.1 putative lipoprotein [Clavibacter sepedonicus]